jgi:hypothetical protein
MERKVVAIPQRSFLSGKRGGKEYAVTKAELLKLQDFAQTESFGLLKRILEDYAKGLAYANITNFEGIKNTAEDSKIIRSIAETVTQFQAFTTISNLLEIVDNELDRRKKEEKIS